MSDPPDWHGWEHPHWNRAVRRWNRKAHVPVARIKFEHLSDVTLQGWNCIDEILRLMDGLSGEMLSMFVLRRERQFSQAEILGTLIEERAGLENRTCGSQLEEASTPDWCPSLCEARTPRDTS